ncbi:MAG: hypothetical protein ACKVUS_13105 [Saprospiraceae bacterium]
MKLLLPPTPVEQLPNNGANNTLKTTIKTTSGKCRSQGLNRSRQRHTAPPAKAAATPIEPATSPPTPMVLESTANSRTYSNRSASKTTTAKKERMRGEDI